MCFLGQPQPNRTRRSSSVTRRARDLLRQVRILSLPQKKKAKRPNSLSFLFLFTPKQQSQPSFPLSFTSPPLNPHPFAPPPASSAADVCAPPAQNPRGTRVHSFPTPFAGRHAASAPRPWRSAIGPGCLGFSRDFYWGFLSYFR